jgi:peroxiredoxin Q/BCP
MAAKKARPAKKPAARAAAKPAPSPVKKTGGLRLLPEGSAAPEFALQDHTGKVWKLSDFRGKKVVLYFYPKDMTPGCTIQACDFRNNYKDIRKKNAIVVGVSVDPPASHRQFSDRHQLNFTLLSDVNKDAVKRYGVWGEKSFLGYRFEGTYRITYIIDENGKIVKVFDRVNPVGHAKQVLESI